MLEQINDSPRQNPAYRLVAFLKTTNMRLIITVLMLSFLMLNCKDKSADKKEMPVDLVATDSTVLKPGKDSALLAMTKEVLTAIKQNDHSTLSTFIHPVAGVRFSPHGYIDTSSDKVVSAEWIKQQGDGKKQSKFFWGTEDGSGESIDRTFDDYVKDFVYDVDFIQPEKMKVNEFIGAGNSQNNLLLIYKDSDFVESHFSGFDKKYEGMDWRSLRLVFKMIYNRYYLIGVVHDEWTT